MKFLAALLASATMLALAPGQPAPSFTLPNQDAKPVKLDDAKGHPVLLYFYPKDGTPGCTTEACMLRDNFVKFQKHGAVIYGISTQNEKSHVDFRKEQKLPFDLLVDAKGEVAKSYGVGFIPNTDLLERKSVLIGKDGKIAKVYDIVKPGEHATEVLKDLDQIK
jgi:peroxiredoxin Q/BCP